MRHSTIGGGSEAYSVDEFCGLFGISRSLFYKLQRRGLAPRTMKLGARQVISRDAVADWKAAREAGKAGAAA